MKITNNYIKILFTFFICMSDHGKTKFTDRQVAMMIPKYFARDHNAPKITRTRVYGENGKKVLHLNIEVYRNRYENQMEYALSAMASVCQHAARPFDTFVLNMEQNLTDTQIGTPYYMSPEILEKKNFITNLRVFHLQNINIKIHIEKTNLKSNFQSKRPIPAQKRNNVCHFPLRYRCPHRRIQSHSQSLSSFDKIGK